MPVISQDIIALYDRFTHGAMDRRTFMERLAALAGGTTAASALLPLLRNDYALAQTVLEHDPRLATSNFQYEIGDAVMNGYLAAPAAEGRRPGVVVIHENRGLNPHIRDVTRRFALEGFIALGVDVLAPEGGTPSHEDEARDMIGRLPADRAAARLAAGVTALSRAQGCTGRVGTVGYCWGGGMVSRIAALNPPGLAAGVSYYGAQIPADQVARIQTPLMLHYASLDDRINAGIDAYRAALEAHGKIFEIHIYEGTNHAFNNDTNPARYNAEAAKRAFARTVAFLRKHLA